MAQIAVIVIIGAVAVVGIVLTIVHGRKIATATPTALGNAIAAAAPVPAAAVAKPLNAVTLFWVIVGALWFFAISSAILYGIVRFLVSQ